MLATGIIAGRKARGKPLPMFQRHNFGEYTQPEVELPTSWGGLPLFFGTDTVCKLLKISAPTVSAYIRSGELKAGKFGGKYRINKDDFKAFVQSKHERTGDS
jgi:excisionase family DNA binding protein